MADEVDAAVLAMEALALGAVVDLPIGQAEFPELAAGHDTLASGGRTGDHRVGVENLNSVALRRGLLSFSA
jgi:hypothetical protein